MSGGLRHGKASLMATPLAAVATLMSLHGFIAMIQWGGWLRTLIAHLVVVSAVVVLLRRFTYSRVLPTLGGVVVAAWAGIVLVVRNDAGGRHWLPSPTALRDAWATINVGIDTIQTSPAPAPVNAGLLAIIVSLMSVLFLLVEHLAVSWRLAALSGAPLLFPWMPAIALHHSISAWYLVIAISAWLLMMAATRKQTGLTSASRPVPALLALGATLGAGAIALPLLLGGPGWGAIPQLAAPDNLDTPTRLNLELDLRESLNNRSNNPVMVYNTTGSKPDAFRLYTFTDFDGAGWDRGDEPEPEAPLSDVLWMSPVDAWSDRQLDVLSVLVLDLAETNLPLPPGPRQVSVNGNWRYDPTWDEVSADGDSIQGVYYEVRTDPAYFTAEMLRGAGAADGEDALLGAAVTDLPDGVDVDRFRALALQLTGDTDTRFDATMAIQEYLRNPDVFTYDPTVSPDGDDYVSTFLDTKQGYCVQFATTMVMLARSIDIPARLAIGFLPGEEINPGEYSVYASDAHAWPEVYFEGIGWVRFEPTPAARTGQPPVHAESDAGASPSPSPSPTASPSPDASGGPSTPPSPTARPSESTGPTIAPTTPSETGDQPWLWVLIGIAALIAVAVAVAVLARRRVEHHVSIESAWQRLRKGLPAEDRWPDSATPAEAVDYVIDARNERGADVTADDSDHLRTIARAVERERYAPEGTEVTGPMVMDRVQGLLERMRRGEPRRRRR